MCPTCGRRVSYGDHVLGTVLEHDVAGAAVELLFACRGCLSILRDVQRHSPQHGAVHDGRVTCAIPGSRVHREIERLRAAAPEDRVHVFAEIAADPARRALLRVPEVFETVRGIYGDAAELLDDAICGWRSSDLPSIPWPPLIRWSMFGREMARVGRLFPNPFTEQDRRTGERRHALHGEDAFVQLPKGTRLPIQQVAKNVLLVLGDAGQPMAVAPDLCIPAL